MPKTEKKASRPTSDPVDAAIAIKKAAAGVHDEPRVVLPASTVQKFSTPAWRRVLGYWLLSSILSALVGFPIIRNDPTGVLWIALATGLYIVLVATALTAQRIEIIGAAIKISTPSSFYRYRQFHAKEVKFLRLFQPRGNSTMIILQIHFEPSPARKWNEISVSKHIGRNIMESINCDRFIALTQAIREAQPGMTVRDLPSNYAGPLGEAGIQ